MKVARASWAMALALGMHAPSRECRSESITAPTEERCLSAYDQGQRLRKKLQLRKARSELLLCARAPCPVAFRKECSMWFDEVDKLVPSVILRVNGAAAVAGIRVVIDGAEAGALEGTPIELDPGEHEIRIVATGRRTAEQHVQLAAGEKSRIVSFVLTEPDRPVTTTPTTTTTTTTPGSAPTPPKPALTPWVFAGLGLVSLASLTYFGVTGLSQRSRLDDCGAFCRQEDIDSTRRRFLIADASLGLSAVSFAIATYLWLRAPSTVPTSPAHAGRWRVAGAALPNVAVIGVVGVF